MPAIRRDGQRGLGGVGPESGAGTGTDLKSHIKLLTRVVYRVLDLVLLENLDRLIDERMQVGLDAPNQLGRPQGLESGL